ncbi:aldo/keto reductase [bacterium]|nr:aldo/keto reductase [bacterium]MBU1063613.1 aldo/keto reductase [bacterium]MBU1635770.1 aldo/keto reductase [bacterium]MBU1873698.1 aldo/keto reductase [bacterium]
MNKQNSLTRRNFLKTAAAGLGGYVMLSPDQSNKTKPISEKQRKIVYRTLGKTGIKVPVISMGVMNADNPNLVKAALDNGIVLLDTAWYYQRGRNEKMIGSVIKDYPRDSYVIATKIHDNARDRETGTFTKDATEKGFLEKFDESLERLGIDYVDILYLHSSYTKEMTLYKPFLKAMEKLKKEGRTRFVGVSTHWNEPEVIQAVTDSKFYDVVLTSYNFKQDHIDQMQEAIAKAAAAGLGIVGMKTFAGGFLDEEKTKPVDHNAAIRFALKNENITTIIPGFTTFDQMEIDIAAMENLTYTEKDSEVLELGFNSRGGVYCQGCQTCADQCPKHLPIPDLMRAHMYAYAYKNYWEAKELVSSLNVDSIQCDDCTRCSVKCVKGFDIKHKCMEIVSLNSVPQRFFV